MAAAAAVGGALAGTAPTGHTVADALWSGALAGVVTLAAARARRWSLLLLAAGAALLASGPARLPAVIALVVVVGGLALDRRDRLVHAAIGALAVQTLLRLPDLGPHGTSALATAVLVLPVLTSGYRASSRATRRRVRQGAAAVTVVVVAATLALVAAGLEGRTDLADGLDRTEEGLDVLRSGEVEEAVAVLDDATASLDRAHSALSSPLVAPARLLPLLGPQVAAGREVADVGRSLTATAADAARDTDLDQLRIEGAAVDLATVAALAEPADRARAELARAEERVAGVERSWLVAPVAEAVAEVDDTVAETGVQLDTLRAGVDAAPWLFGADGPRRYLVLFANPAEARGGGGFVGGYGVLVAHDGRLDLVRSGRIGELERAAGWEARTLSGPDDFLARYGRYFPTRYLKNVTASPDFPTVGAVLAELYPQAVPGETLDGVLYLDPYALAALLEVTGPVAVDGLEEPLDADTAPTLLLKEQYVRFPDPDARADLLEAAARAAFDALRTTTLDGPDALVDALAPAVRKGRLRLWVTDPASQRFLARLGLDGTFPDRAGGDLLSVRTANAAPNKMDAYLARRIDYDVTVDTVTGDTSATATVTLENRAPGDLPDYVAGNAALRDGRQAPPAGTALVYLSAYTPLGLVGATLAGEALPVEAQEELGLHVYSAHLEVPPGGTVTVAFELEGRVATTDGYRLTVGHPPLVIPDEVTLTARREGGPAVRSTVPPGDAITRWRPDLG